MRLRELIGNTPMILLKSLGNDDREILLKLEKNNPGGSIKDRTVLGMIIDAEKRGILSPGATIVEPTSGNTGIAIAMLSAVRGYRAVMVMPESMSQERIKVLKAFGAEVILTPADLGMNGSRQKALEIVKNEPSAVMLNQFSNPANPLIHELTTGPEILVQAEFDIDAFVCGIGTGGTVTGVGRVLKKVLPNVKIYGVEPAGSPVITENRSGKHKIQGIGAGFIPDILDLKLLDGVLTVTDEEAIEMTKYLQRKEGLLVGISSGANVAAALRLSKEGFRRVVTIAPDHLERYLSSGIITD